MTTTTADLRTLDQVRADIRRLATDLTNRQMRNRAKDSVKRAKRAIGHGNADGYVRNMIIATEWRAIADEHPTPRPRITLAQYLAGHTTTRGDHRIWLGPRNAGGVPVSHYDGTTTAARATWFVERGTWPDSRLSPACDEPLCVTPAHHDDRAARQRTRALYAAVTGRYGSYSDTCGRGHPRAEHTLLLPSGIPYCDACLRLRKELASTSAGAAR